MVSFAAKALNVINAKTASSFILRLTLIGNGVSGL